MSRVRLGGLQVAVELAEFVELESIPLLGLDSDKFWFDFGNIVSQFTPRNVELLTERERLQQAIDDWHRNNQFDVRAYQSFLTDIGYLETEVHDFSIETANVDEEIARIAGPQLVVPVKNARFAINAANARWGSLYDALYGTDAIAEDDGAERAGGYNPVRGEQVINTVRDFLDRSCPIAGLGFREVDRFTVGDGRLVAESEGQQFELSDGSQFAGYQGEPDNPSALLLVNHGLHIELQIDRAGDIGTGDRAGINDVILEAAVTTIQDCEDSVAAVDAVDKVEVYHNWLGLMRGNLQARFAKDGKDFNRRLEPDRQYLAPDGTAFSLHGRSLLLVRNVGHLMRNPAILDQSGEEMFEGIMDAVITSAIATADVIGNNELPNSRSGSVYIVKPKMHGSTEVAFCCDLFAAVETMLDLPANTLKIGIMDEERRTTLNLKNCIYQARQRVVFINTGFLDRTGDEIHTSMQAGALIPKTRMKASTWIGAYEDNNVNLGLQCGFQGRAQIGKGMWAMPDLMARMLEEKIAHPRAGANTAWVPSPTAAVLHAMHYHQVDVAAVQTELTSRDAVALTDLLTIPLQPEGEALSGEVVQQELDNNTQGILGYVVRWIDQGIGCSKVPDINDIGLMEDRATLRISSQHLANWLLHGICDEQQVMESMQRMAAKVDEQNRHDPGYRAMAPGFDDSIAFQAACDLVFKGVAQPSGYTEPLLHAHRLRVKKERQ